TPIISCNNLWQKVEGVIDAWNACEHLPADLRQLRVVRPDQPRIVTEYWTGWFDRWSGEHRDNQSTELLEYRLAGILAQGAQYNLYMFHGGTNFAFYGGRSVAVPDCFMTTSYDYDAPLSEAGGRGPKYRATQRLSMFASQFGHVLANLDPADHHVAVQPVEQEHDLSVIHQRGSQGDVVFLLRPPQGKAESKTHNPAKLLLSNGLSLPVYMGEDAAAWVLLGARLNSCELNYTNLRPWAWLSKRMLVLFGPAGTQGLLAINNAPLTVTVPVEKQDKPLVVEHEDVVVVVLNRRQVDMAYVNGKDQLVIGAWALDAADQPLRDPKASAVMLVDQEAKIRKLNTPAPPRRTPLKLGPWRSTPAAELTSDSGASFKPIGGPASLEALGCDFGYGWYRLQWPTVPKMPAGTKLLIPNSGDRLHLYAGNKAMGVLGLGPGAVRGAVSNRLPAKAQELTILADNLGRYNFGWRMGESKGVPEHLYAVKPIAVGKPKVTREAAPNPFVLSDFWVNLRAGATGQRPWFTFTFRAKGSEPVVLEATDFPLKAMVFINDQPLNLIDTSPWGSYTQFVLRPGQELKPGGGVQTLRIALLQPTDKLPNPSKHLKLYQAVANLSAKAQWSFTPWSPPTDGGESQAKLAPGLPCWHRTSFKVSHNDTPLWLDPAGLSKGQIYLNGHNVGRYFVATTDGKKVTPQTLYYLPEPWLRTDGPNELVIFDEHGKSPAPAPGRGCRLVYDWMAPYNRTT
ncbi:MAG: beta-galactosidase, partial [Phycisphaeraceae bacterium]|nr:beta-galactosidase [Phycisphaeraceae bacterium]